MNLKSGLLGIWLVLSILWIAPMSWMTAAGWETPRPVPTRPTAAEMAPCLNGGDLRDRPWCADSVPGIAAADVEAARDHNNIMLESTLAPPIVLFIAGAVFLWAAANFRGTSLKWRGPKKISVSRR
jgi:hypothetical protein